ncbi:MAG: EamA family transporter [Candidatus Altiarchaeales archaeon]|nr:EamA family transporter [Candidatus Altiarchaeales archaeon]MBD3416716.1 EamA family transporter [Candidatus Altiarchaeales archaeon]
MDAVRRGEVSILSSCLFFALAALLIKLASSSFSGLFIAFFRFSLGAVLSMLALKAFHRDFRAYDLKHLTLRAVFGVSAMVSYYHAIQFTSSGRATLLNLTYPIFVAFYGFLFFKEAITRRNVFSILLCVIGVLTVFYDGTYYPLFGNFLGLASGALSGFAVHYIRKSRERNNPVIVYLAPCLLGLLACSPSIGESANLELSGVLLLSSVAVLTFLGQLNLTYGYRYVQPTRGSVISFFTIPLAILFSLFIGEEMTLRFFIGTALIMLGLFINRK